MKILITGGAGYLGRTIAYTFSDNGHTCIIIDNTDETLDIPNSVHYKEDISNKEALFKILNEHKDIEIVIHCAELSSVALSVTNPYEYYSLNVFKTIEFFKSLNDFGLKKIIYSSSAAVYENVPGYMVTEKSPLKPRSPFGRTKHITEMILKDFCDAYNMKCIALRYFNPIGAETQTRCGFRNNSHNIINKLIKVYMGEESTFEISGDDWDTRDGSCVRDYIHISDVAKANLLAAENFNSSFENAGREYTNYLSINIGSGIDVTVKEFIIAFENVTGEHIHTTIGKRRQGDISGSYANVQLAKRAINWTPTLTLEDAIFDAMKWYEKNQNQ